jgi:hypothetical protein
VRSKRRAAVRAAAKPGGEDVTAEITGIDDMERQA